MKLNYEQLENLFSDYKSNYDFLWFKDFNESEEFFNYLVAHRLLKQTIKHGAYRDSINGWGYAVRELSEADW